MVLKHPRKEKISKEEQGSITVIAEEENDFLKVIMFDDGKGLDINAIQQKANVIKANAELTSIEIANLIFMPGVNAADAATDIFDRGVGLDVIKKLYC